MLSAMSRSEVTAARIRSGDRNALALAITLVESRRPEDEARAEALLAELLPHTGRAIRLGITGAPGVGKSTFIEAFGRRLTATGRKVAVLAVDPTSARSGGSLLADKTRMPELARDPDAFIRPSPSGSTPGGVARRTREALLLCEAAGYGVVLVETVGTGQSETAVASMVDLFLLLLSPAAGDELQGIKRGVMELCDLVLVHKADGALAAAAGRVRQQCATALQVLRGVDAPPVLLGSSVTGAGLDELWRAVEERHAALRADGALDEKRRAQAAEWLDAEVRDRLVAAFLVRPEVDAALRTLRQEVRAGQVTPHAAARRLLALAPDGAGP
jgi:LAO/AO transport system kinase